MPLRTHKLVLPFVAWAGMIVPAMGAAAPQSRADASIEASPAVRLEQIDGGLGYYGRFAHPLPTSDDFFPIAVWGAYNHTKANRDADADVGLNTYVWVADSSFMPEIRSDGRFRVIQTQDDRAAVGSETAGWELDDEIDMTDGAAACGGRLREIKDSLPVDGRLRYNNYGKGVLLWLTDAEAACFVEAQDVVSSDLYWFTDPWQLEMVAPPWLPEWDPDPDEEIITGGQVRRAANYGYQVDRMRALDARDGQRKPIWAFVETGWPFAETAVPGARAIAPAEVRAAVWHSLIAGARGVIYFNHSFGGPCLSHHVLRDVGCYPAVREMVKSVNAQIKSLAPVLNAPTAASGWTTTPSVRAMVKWYDGHFFVFAGSTDNVGSTGAFSMPCVGDATAVRLGESGRVPVTNGRLSDAFEDGNAIHIYRIDGGSNCGLAPGARGDGRASQPDGSSRRRGARIRRLPRRISLRSGRLKIRVTCVAECRVRSRLTIRRASRRVVLAAAHRRFSAGRHALVLRLSRGDRRRAAEARVLRLRTVLVEPGGSKRLTQRLVLRH